MEPDWTKQIPSTAICNFFYVFFVINAVIFAIAVLTTIGVFGYFKKLGIAGLAMSVQALIMTLIGGTQMLFFYLICDRALLAGSAKAIAEGFRR